MAGINAASENEASTSPIENLSTPHLREKLTRERKNQDPMRFYEVNAVLGGGSMGSVSKVKKREDALGGSARPKFLKTLEDGIFLKLLRCFHIDCCDPKEDSEESCNSKDIFLKSQSSFSSTGSKTGNGEERRISSMISFTHRDAFYALKSIHLAQARNKTFRDELKNEVEILKTLDHPVSTYYCASTSSEKINALIPVCRIS